MEPILKRIVRLVKGLETTEERSVLQRAGRSLGGIHKHPLAVGNDTLRDLE